MPMHNIMFLDTYALLRERLTVDRHNIDQEYVENPSLLHQALECLSLVGEARDRRRAAVKVAETAATIEIRASPSPSGKGWTEGAIAAEVSIDANVNEAREQYQAIGLDVQAWEGLVEGLRARGYTLRGLTDMACAGMLVQDAGRKRTPVAEVIERRRTAEIADNAPLPQRRRVGQ